MSKAAVLATQRVPRGPLHCSLCLRTHVSLLIYFSYFVEHLLGARLTGLWGPDRNKLPFLPSGNLHVCEKEGDGAYKQ